MQLPYCAYVMAFSQTELFLDALFPEKCARYNMEKFSDMRHVIALTSNWLAE